MSFPRSVFVTLNDDIYTANTAGSLSVDLWTANATSSVAALVGLGSCTDVFVDDQNSLYCSLLDQHKVVKKLFSSSASTTMIVAGNGTVGFSSTLLNSQAGIFVDVALQLYVADCGNNRVQRFPFGELSGTTVAGNGLMGAMPLHCPTSIIIDSNNYLFIADYYGDRIVSSGPNGFRCILGCSGVNGSSSNQLHSPEALRFDSYGNLFVVEHLNSRIQKFLYQPSSCSNSK